MEGVCIVFRRRVPIHETRRLRDAVHAQYEQHVDFQTLSGYLIWIKMKDSNYLQAVRTIVDQHIIQENGRISDYYLGTVDQDGSMKPMNINDITI